MSPTSGALDRLGRAVLAGQADKEAISGILIT